MGEFELASRIARHDKQMSGKYRSSLQEDENLKKQPPNPHIFLTFRFYPCSSCSDSLITDCHFNVVSLLG